jgi:DNA mismatch endonuclease (patch repair protein)
MALIRDRDTKLELRFRRALHAAGVRGWRCHVRGVFGVPDLAWKARKIAVFVDSAWWHGHPSRWTPGKLPGRWDDKIRGNKARDAEVTARLEAEGWLVLRLWDFEIQRDLDACVGRVQAALETRPPS